MSKTIDKFPKKQYVLQHKITPLLCLYLSFFGFVFLSSASADSLEEPFDGPIYLNFKDDPVSNMVVIYHLKSDREALHIYYREKGAVQWNKKLPEARQFQNEPKHIYHGNLTGLTADKKYEFKIGKEGDVYLFRTMPEDLSKPILGAFGADFQQGPEVWVHMIKLALSHDVDFFVVAGDWVNDDGNINNSGNWVEFWDLVWRELINSNGRMIPFVAGVGNHECKHDVNMDRFFFTDMFAFPDEGEHEFYGVIDIGNYISLIALDTEMESISDQHQWLQGVLDDRDGVKYIIPYYHRPLFPSHRGSFRYRLTWFESFYNAGIRAAFSGHDHTYKRTHELVWDEGHENKVRIAEHGEKGLIEFGDGGLGSKFYSGNLHDEWYMAETGINFNHLSIVYFKHDRMRVTTRNGDNELIFETEIFNPESVRIIKTNPGATLRLPNNSFQLETALEVGSALQLAESDLNYLWEITEAPGDVKLHAANTANPIITVTAPGTYILRARVVSPVHEIVGEEFFSIDFKPLIEPQGSLEAELTEDTFARRWVPDATQDFTTEIQLMDRNSNAAREGFLKFTLELPKGLKLSGAKLSLYQAEISTPYTGELILLDDNNWSEGTLTWNNRPTEGTVVATWSRDGTPGWFDLELEPDALDSLPNGNTFSFRLSITSQVDSWGAVIRYASKDGQHDSNRARFTVDGRILQSYKDWLRQENIPEGEQEYDFKRFGTGLSNLTSYLTGLSRTKPGFSIISIQQNTWQVSLPWKEKIPPSAFFVLEQSVDLKSWAPFPWNQWEMAPMDDKRALFETSIPIDNLKGKDASAGFLRLRMENR